MTVIDASQQLRQLFNESWLNKTAKQQGSASDYAIFAL
jgi:hypothetical protein